MHRLCKHRDIGLKKGLRGLSLYRLCCLHPWRSLHWRFWRHTCHHLFQYKSWLAVEIWKFVLRLVLKLALKLVLKLALTLVLKLALTLVLKLALRFLFRFVCMFVGGFLFFRSGWCVLRYFGWPLPFFFLEVLLVLLFYFHYSCLFWFRAWSVWSAPRP